MDISKKKNKKDDKQEKVHTYVYNCFIESSTYFVCTALVHVYTYLPTWGTCNVHAHDDVNVSIYDLHEYSLGYKRGLRTGPTDPAAARPKFPVYQGTHK